MSDFAFWAVVGGGLVLGASFLAYGLLIGVGHNEGRGRGDE